MSHFTALLKLEMRADDHDEANDKAWAAKTDIENIYGFRVTLVNDQCEQVDVSAADMVDDGAAR